MRVLCRSTSTSRIFWATPNNAQVWIICLPKLPCPCIDVEQSCPTQCEQSDPIISHDAIWWCTTWTMAKQTHIVGLHGATRRCIAYLLQASCPTAAHRLDILPTPLKRSKCVCGVLLGCFAIMRKYWSSILCQYLLSVWEVLVHASRDTALHAWIKA